MNILALINDLAKFLLDRACVVIFLLFRGIEISKV